MCLKLFLMFFLLPCCFLSVSKGVGQDVNTDYTDTGEALKHSLYTQNKLYVYYVHLYCTCMYI